MLYSALLCCERPPQCADDEDENGTTVSLDDDNGDLAQHPKISPSSVASLQAELARSWTSLGFGPTANLCRDLWSAIIRPPRRAPSAAELDGMKLYAVSRSHCACFYERQDMQLRNSRGQTLECSHFVPIELYASRRPCVVYLHGSSSNRFEVKHVLKYLLQYDVTVFCFDFAGSGQSDGDYVSLGYHEEQDLQAVLEHLRGCEGVDSIALWGWSMGAVAALMRASEDQLLSGCVLDSPFADFCVVAAEQVLARAPFAPRMLVDFFVKLVLDEACTRHCGFDPKELKPIVRAPKASIPAMFGAARDDVVTPSHHTQELHDHWGGDKSVYTFDGGHTSQRPQWFLETAADFLWNSFKQAQAWRAEDTRVFPACGTPDVFQQLRNIIAMGKRPTPYFVEPRGPDHEKDPPILCVAEPQDTTSPRIVSC